MNLQISRFIKTVATCLLRLDSIERWQKDRRNEIVGINMRMRLLEPIAGIEPPANVTAGAAPPSITTSLSEGAPRYSDDDVASVGPKPLPAPAQAKTQRGATMSHRGAGTIPPEPSKPLAQGSCIYAGLEEIETAPSSVVIGLPLSSCSP